MAVCGVALALAPVLGGPLAAESLLAMALLVGTASGDLRARANPRRAYAWGFMIIGVGLAAVMGTLADLGHRQCGQAPTCGSFLHSTAFGLLVAGACLAVVGVWLRATE